MKNIKIDIRGTILFIQIDLTKSSGISKSGKSTMIASTGGFQIIAEGKGEKLNLNLVKPLDLNPK